MSCLHHQSSVYGSADTYLQAPLHANAYGLGSLCGYISSIDWCAATDNNTDDICQQTHLGIPERNKRELQCPNAYCEMHSCILHQVYAGL